MTYNYWTQLQFTAVTMSRIISTFDSECACVADMLENYDAVTSCWKHQQLLENSSVCTCVLEKQIIRDLKISMQTLMETATTSNLENCDNFIYCCYCRILCQ